MNWKAVLLAVISVAILFCIPTKALAKGTENYYPTCGVITEINEATDTVVFVDFSGREWSFYGIEDYAEGDIIAVIMNDKGTEIVFDDEIVSAKYCG